MRSIWLCGLAAGIGSVLALAQTSPEPQFARDVLPLLSNRCGTCHGSKAHMAGLILNDPALILRGGQNGPVITKGSPDKSLLIQRVKEGSMPPGGTHLSSAEIGVLEAWIRTGAPGAVESSAPASYRSQVSDQDRQFWSFRPLVQPPVPQVRHASAVATPVDAFVLAKLEEKELQYAKPAESVTLVRRAYLDLLGLPPAPVWPRPPLPTGPAPAPLPSTGIHHRRLWAGGGD